MGEARAEIAASIERTLTEQARQNEVRIGYARTLALLLTTAVNVAAFLDARELGVAHLAPTNFVLTGLFAVASAALVWAMRRGIYRAWWRLALPFADALMVLALFYATTRSLDPVHVREGGVLVNMAALCGLFAVSGGLRLTRRSALLTTALAVAIFTLVSAHGEVGFLRTAFPVSLLLGCGLLSTVMTDIVRKSVQSEVTRSVLARFLPSRVIEDVQADPLGLITTPRSLDATVVVTDLRGFTAISEPLSPTEVLAFLNEVQGVLAGIVHAHGGTIDKFMGDGMLAVFGAPEPQEDHAARALAATKEMVDAMADMAVGHTERVRVGVGVHSGEVVAGCLGSGSKLEFTVLGDTVNAASRLEALTKQHGVSALVSRETRARALTRPGDAVPELVSRGEVQLRGRAEPLEVYGLREDRQSLLDAPGPTP